MMITLDWWFEMWKVMYVVAEGLALGFALLVKM